MLVGLLIFSPVFVDALTEDEAKKIMEDLPIVEKDGKCTFTTNTISYEDMIKNSCGFTYKCKNISTNSASKAMKNLLIW